jgi:hypothetical protein
LPGKQLGTEQRKTIRQHFEQKDWGGPLAECVHTVFLLLLDAAKIFLLFAIAKGLEALLNHFEIKPIKLESYHVEIPPQQIIEKFDYMLLLMFLLALIYRVGKGMWEDR